MFQGTYTHSMDAKNRLFIPAKFREELGDSFVICPSPDGCLFVYTEAHWADIAEQIAEKSRTREDRMRQRHAFYGVTTVVPDKQGRITIPAILMDMAGLEKDVMIFGMTKRIEIWDLHRWNNMMEVVTAAENGVEDEELFPEINY